MEALQIPTDFITEKDLYLHHYYKAQRGTMRERVELHHMTYQDVRLEKDSMLFKFRILELMKRELYDEVDRLCTKFWFKLTGCMRDFFQKKKHIEDLERKQRIQKEKSLLKLNKHETHYKCEECDHVFKSRVKLLDVLCEKCGARRVIKV